MNEKNDWDELICVFGSDGYPTLLYHNRNGKQHNEDGPARITYGDEGFVRGIYYFINGESHRTDGPADIFYNTDGSVSAEFYFVDGQSHRLDGPSDMYFTNYPVSHWNVRGKHIEIDEFLEEIGMDEMNEEAIIMFGLKYG